MKRFAPLLLLGACLEPTEIEIVLQSDACSRIRFSDGVKIYFPPSTDKIDDDDLVESAIARTCTGNRIGNLFVVPSGKTGDVSIRVVAPVDATTSCRHANNWAGCIVERRILHFVPHTHLVLPIDLDASCVDVPCTGTTTCVNGRCVDATIDPMNCTRTGCRPTGDGGGPQQYTIDWLAAGRNDTCMRISTGQMFCWGYDTNSGVLGLPPGPNLDVPTHVPALDGAKQIAFGATNGCAVDKQNALVCWGKNDVGQQGNGMVSGAVSPPTVNAAIPNVLAIAAGYGHVCARAADSSVSCWGLRTNSQVLGMTNLVPTMQGVNASVLSLGGMHSCTLPGGGGGSAFAVCWGSNGQHQAGGAMDFTTPTAVGGAIGTLLAAGEAHTCVATPGGRDLLCWGDLQMLAGSGTASPATFTVPTSSTIDAITASDGFNCVHTAAGEIFCWGANPYGQLANGNVTSQKLTAQTKPVPIGKPVLGVTVGTGHACAWTKTEAWCWGNGTLGQLGDGTLTIAQTAPSPIVLPP
jgi:hypothetical protein